MHPSSALSPPRPGPAPTAPGVNSTEDGGRAPDAFGYDPGEAVIAIQQASKDFGTVEAIRRLDLIVPPSQITVLLGPNGAGKTTAIRLITGSLPVDRGSVRVFGLDPSGSDGESVRIRCGVVSAKPSLYDRLSGLDNLRYAAELYGLGRGLKAHSRIREAAAQFGIDHALDQLVGGYSTGMKTRLALARAILHRPWLLLLDEPTSGLDPESAVAVLAMVRDMTAEGRTVLMCTHLLLEAEGLADRIVVMDRGASLLAGSPDELARLFWPTPAVDITARIGAELDRLADAQGVIGYQRSERTARVELDRADRIPQLISSLSGDGVALESVVPFRPSLEDLYFAIRRSLIGPTP